MDLLLDLLTAIGVATAIGVRPYLATVVVGVLALADVGVDFDGTALSFLENPLWLVAVALLGVYAAVRKVPAAALLGGSVLVGALEGGAILDDRHQTWWYGMVLGAACAFLAATVAGEVFGRVQERLAKQGADGTLPVYAEVIAGVASLLSALTGVLGIAVLGGVAWLGVQQRRRADQKYAGLRILR